MHSLSYSAKLLHAGDLLYAIEALIPVHVLQTSVKGQPGTQSSFVLQFIGSK